MGAGLLGFPSSNTPLLALLMAYNPYDLPSFWRDASEASLGVLMAEKAFPLAARGERIQSVESTGFSL